jgi:hypothetical protein
MEVSSESVLSAGVSSDLEAASQPFLGRWHRLISTTNWEKGRIIADWRQALVDAGSAAVDYADEAWANRVGGVTSQHVGRLRRVYAKFGATHTSYEGLYWSHFQAAVDWNDAEMWLEGALHNDWSVSQMRQQRAGTLGEVAARADELAAQVDAEATTEQAAAEDSFDSSFGGEDRITPSVARVSAADLEDGVDSDEDVVDEAADAPFGTDDDVDEVPSPRRVPTVQPFADLPELPEDLQAAFDTFKLAILNHRREGWAQMSCDDVVATLDALKTLALAPLED